MAKRTLREKTLIEEMFDFYDMHKMHFTREQLREIFFPPMQMMLDDHIEKKINEALKNKLHE